MSKKITWTADLSAFILAVFMAYGWHYGHHSLVVGYLSYMVILGVFRQAKDLNY